MCSLRMDSESTKSHVGTGTETTVATGEIGIDSIAQALQFGHEPSLFPRRSW